MRSVMTTTLLLMGTLLVAVTGAAQASVSDVLQVEIPFPFVVGTQDFPAGQYMVMRDDLASPILMLRGERGIRESTILATRPADGRDPAGDKPALLFTRHENHYRLSSVWLSGDNGQRVLNR